MIGVLNIHIAVANRYFPGVPMLQIPLRHDPMFLGRRCSAHSIAFPVGGGRRHLNEG